MRLRGLAGVSTLLGVLHAAHAWQFGVEQRFVEEKLVVAGSLGLPKTGLVAAFGDFNADQLLDVFFLSADQRSLSVYEWDREQYEFRERVESRIRTPSSFVIVNVVPGDYDYDGRLDVLLMGERNPGGWWGKDDELEMEVYLQLSDGSFCASLVSDQPGRADGAR